jgi:hypothetical protein
MTGVTSQLRTLRVAVILGVRNIADDKGGAANLEIDDLFTLTDAALFGWLPDEKYNSALMLVSGGILETGPGVIWWQDIYETNYDHRV